MVFGDTRGVRGKAAGDGFTSVPALCPHRSHTICASALILSETEPEINSFLHASPLFSAS